MANQLVANITSLLNDQHSWSSSGTLYTKIDSATARNIFTTAFLVLNILIEIVGEYFLKRRNQRRLIDRKGRNTTSVPFSLLTPWLSLSSLATYFWKTRALPGGLLGFLMAATGAFGLLQHYMVNSFILPVMLPTWCEFQAGIVTTAHDVEVTPSPSWSAALLVFGAHTAVTATKGEIGVYNKINVNITSFQPTTADVLGSWTCNALADSIIQPTDWVDTASVESYLDAQDFLSPSTRNLAGATSLKDGSYQGFVAWSGTLDSNSSSSWEINTTIVNGLGGRSSLAASNFKCSLVKYDPTWIPTPMPSNATLATWANIMYGFVSEVQVYHYGTQLEIVLNSMSILAGSGNQNNLRLSAGANPNYGCVMLGSKVYIAVYLILVLLFLILLTLLVADLYQLIGYRLNKRRGLVKEIPTDLISWQPNMVRRMTRNKSLETKDLHKYSYVFSEETGDFEFMKIEIISGDAESTGMPKDSPPYTHNSYSMENISKTAGIRSSQRLLENDECATPQHDIGPDNEQLRP
ncbi:hypothetical protein EG329_002368 [Mollisiaceae sp. DMI_Dod_QoI]|nr:hypothetical protein EG329_002368 [Helotiales sp. DMI_Dod_QoI]